ncbi:hypothetical protein E2562_026778 [Oryza meyeriana var. granulata]|uniref:NB-ARC domain-containing protein n=1 Tax=Oryza meyeriana var. granulata TaxID=110450 RepID=A0A6G1C7K7_9ORYZ|nr:hypothetical protein E2562_026778 [Oryza meyeriana var. granulata]
MAELAIDISKTAVEALVNKVNSAIKEEEEQWQTVKRDLVFITDELEMMQSFLNSADGEMVKTNLVRTWVRQVRNLSYDLEDCIEFILHLDTDKRSWWLRLLPSCSCGKEGVALPVDDAVTDMKQLKARVEDVSQRNIRYRFVGETASRTLTQQHLVSGSAIGAPGFDILAEARDTAARRTGVVDLISLITEKSDDLRVISLWGTGDDLGTVSIIRDMYDDSRIYGNFRCRAWVKMMHPINPHELVRNLVVQFYANSFQEKPVGRDDALSWLLKHIKKQRDALSWTETSAGDLVKEFLRQVDTHRYLIILEDLSTVVQWDAIRPYLRGSSNGSRVVVSTRHHEIASLCTGKPYRVSELHRISANQSICIFFRPGFVPAGGGIMDGGVPKQKYVEYWLAKNRLVGRDLEVEKLFNLINDRPHANRPHVVSLWGIPGSGRTALVTYVYYRYYYETQFDSRKNVCSTIPVVAAADIWDGTHPLVTSTSVLFDRWAIVNMPQPYNLMGFCRCLLESGLASGSSPQHENPIERCREVLHTHRCLVVIDEVQSKEDWDSMKDANLISAESKSCIVVITVEESVAIHCAGADDLVCSIKCLQPTAAFDLFEQAFQEQVFQEQAFPNNRNSFEEQEFHRNIDSFVEQTLDYIFEANGQEEQAFQNDGNSLQNDGNSVEEQSFQNNGNSIEEQICENNGNSLVEQIFQNNRNYFEGQASHSNGTLLEEQVFQNNGKSVEDQAFQNNGSSFEEQALQNNGNLLEEQALQNNRNLFEEQVFQNNRKLFEEREFQNNENSLEEQAFQNNGYSFQYTVPWLFEMNKQEEYAFENGRRSFQEQALQNSEKSFEEQSFQNGENSYKEVVFPHKRNLLEEVNAVEDNISRNNPNVSAILSRSGGLPQVIVALARYLAKQHKSRIGIREREWSCQRLIANFMQELQSTQEFYCLRGLFAWMRSYFCSCTPSLMRSMLYLLIFPRGNTFRRRRLVRRWIAEGYAKGSESNSLEEMGELFHKLVSQSVIQQATMDAADYEVNGFFHEYMISRPMEEKILSPLEVSVLEGYCRLTTKGVGQHLAIWSCWDRNKIVFDSLDLLRLRSLTVFGRLESFFISDKMRVLRVLDLEKALNVTNVDVDNIGKVLLRLKFLSLRGCKEITLKGLPDSFGRLRQLQTLDIRCTSIVWLSCITKLQKLQYVRAGDDDTSTVEILRPAPPQEASSAIAAPSLSAPSSSMTRPRSATPVSRLFQLPESWTRRCQWLAAVAGSRNGGAVVPRGIGKMTTLHTLGVIDVRGASGRAILEELKNLTQLRKLGVSGVSRRNCRELCSAISAHAHLESLSVQLDKKNNQGCLDAISKPPKDAISKPPNNLQSLKLYGYADDELPIWIWQLPKLSKLNLQMTMLLSDGELQFRSGFDSLVVLEIACSPRLQAVTFHSGVMRNLECLKLRCCNISSLRLSGLKELTILKEVWLIGSYGEAFKQQLQSQIAEHPRKVKLVLKP